MRKIILGVLATLLLNACTWVKETRKASDVKRVDARYAASCTYLGLVDAKVLSEVGGIKRSDKKVASEVETLAKNNAADMKGNTIVSASNLRNGKQSFKVYNCAGY